MTAPFAVSPATNSLLEWHDGTGRGKYLESKTAEELTQIFSDGSEELLAPTRECWCQLQFLLEVPIEFLLEVPSARATSYFNIINALSTAWQGEAAEETIGAIKNYHDWLHRTYQAILFLIERIEKTQEAFQEARLNIVSLEEIKRNRRAATQLEIENSSLDASRRMRLEEEYNTYYNKNVEVVQNYFGKIRNEALQLSQNPFTPPPGLFAFTPSRKNARSTVFVDPDQV